MTTLSYTGKPGAFNPAAALDRLIDQGVDPEKLAVMFDDDLSKVVIYIFDDPEDTIRTAVEAEFAHHDPSVPSAQQQAAAEQEANRDWAKSQLESLDTSTLDNTLAALVLLVGEK